MAWSWVGAVFSWKDYLFEKSKSDPKLFCQSSSHGHCLYEDAQSKLYGNLDKKNTKTKVLN